MIYRAFLLVALCSAPAVTPVTAQSGGAPTLHSLTGIVRDSTGAIMVAADVVLTREGGEPRTTTTGDRGTFEFRDLPRGRYSVAAFAAGFAEISQSVDLGDRQVVSIELVLQLRLEEHVQVSAPGVLSASTGLASTTLTGAALDALPDDSGALLQRVRELAGATDSAGQIIVTVDGFRELLWLPPKQAIQAIRISSNWFAAEHAEPGIARIDIITKPGGASMRGDVSANFNDETLNARNALASQHPAGNMHEVTGYLSGPVIRDRLSFVVYRGYWAQQQSRVINATVLDQGYMAAPRLDTVLAPSRVDNLWIGTTSQLVPTHILAMSFSATTDRAGNLGLDSGLDLPERAYHRRTSDRSLKATLTSVPSKRSLNELRVQVHPQHSTTEADNAAPAVIVLDAFKAGGNQEALFTDARHIAVELNDVVTLSVSRHTLKAGLETRAVNRRYADGTNPGGIFVFGADFERDTSGDPVRDAAGDRLVISPLENYRRTLLAQPGYGPSQFSMTSGHSDVRFRETSVGAFAQDDWTLAPRLTVSYGIRSDWQSAASQPGVGLRAGLAVALDDARRNVIRVGAGNFYQRIEPELTLDVARADLRDQQQIVVDEPAFFPSVPADVATGADTVSTAHVADDRLRAPQILMSAATYEREVRSGAFLTVKYSYQHGTGLLRMRTDPGEELDAPAGRILQYEATGRLRRHELLSGWRWNTGSRGSVFANYTFVHGRSDTDGRTTAPADGSRLDLEFGPAAADRVHAANIGAHFNLPSHVSLSPYVTAASGRAFNITTGLDNNGDGLFTDRPALVASGTPGAIDTPYGWFLADPTADAAIASRNLGRDPAMVRLDVRISRAFRYKTTGSFLFAANVENVLNRSNFEGVNGVITSPSFGEPKRAGLPRRINIAASFSF